MKNQIDVSGTAATDLTIGRRYHVVWAKRSITFRLEKIEENGDALIINPRTSRVYKTPADTLRDTAGTIKKRK